MGSKTLDVGGSNMTVELREDNTLHAEAQTGNKQWIAILTDTHPKYNYDRDFVAYQKPRTSNRDSGMATVEEGDVIERVRYTHSGKNRKDRYYQLVDGEVNQIDEIDVEAAIDGEIIPDIEEETHECDECGDEFGSEHGLAVHEGMVHKNGDEEDPDEAPAEKTNNARQAVADGGVDHSDYDVDPTEFDYGIKCRTHDSTNSRTNYLGRIEDTDIWVAYRTWQTGPNDYGHAIKGIGRFTLSGTELDTDIIAETIREESPTDIRDDQSEWTETDEKLTELVEMADEVADAIRDEWQIGSEEVVGKSVYDGVAGVSGTLAWVSHVEEAYHYEVEEALREVGLEDDEHGRVYEYARRGLSNAVREHRNSWLCPHLEYQTRLEFQIEAWRLRAFEHEQQGVLKNKRELAKTKALLEEGHDYREIADKLDKHRSTISRQKGQIEDWEGRSEWTVDELQQHA